MGDKEKCPVCGGPGKFIQFAAEEVPAPEHMKREDIGRKPPFGSLARNFLVECEIHGRKIVQVEGHHISTIPKKRKSA